MNTNVKKCLFGGALLGAGLCSPATAGDVIWDDAYSYSYVYTIANNDYAYDATDSGSWSVDASIPSGDYANNSGGTFGLDMAAFSTGYGGNYAYAYTIGYVTFATDTSLLLNWDSDFAYIYIAGYSYVDFEYHEILFSNSAVDSIEYLFLTGEAYYVYFHIQSNGLGNLATFNMSETTVNVVPLPPAAFGGLAMLAGLGAYRRIRK